MKLPQINIKNKRASFDYELLDTFHAGIVLSGTEIKSIRLGKAGLTDSFCYINNGEIWIKNMYIAEYFYGSYNNHSSRRDRKLLLTHKEIQKIEITIPIKGNIVRAEQVSDDMYVSIDLVEEVIERQLRKYKNKLVDKQQAATSLSKAFIEEEIEDDDEIKIIRSKKFGMKPMDPEEACIQMDLLGHNFYVFRNAATDEVNVVYKRKGNTFGLIEPEF